MDAVGNTGLAESQTLWRADKVETASPAPKPLRRLDISNLANRTRLTLTCRDADDLPRVADAGALLEENGVKVQVMHNGVRVMRDCYYGSFITSIIEHLRGFHEPQEEKCFHEILKFIRPGSTMLELGCYWGFYSLWFWKAIKDAHCHLMELDNVLLEVAVRNFEINGAKGIFTNAGIGTPDLSPWKISSKKNYFRAQADGGIYCKAKEHLPDLRRNVPIVTVDQYMADNEIEYLDILHSDIQGEELNMLLGAEHALKNKKIGYLVISTHWADAFHDKVLQKTRELGYFIIAEHNVTDSYSGDGLIVARLPELAGPGKVPISLRSDSIF